MDKPYTYEIRVEGQLTNRWADWFEGLTFQAETDAETTLIGPLVDQAALLGVLNQLQSLNLTVISVKRLLPRE